MESETYQSGWTEEQTAEASEKVLRRAKVSRMARQLQSRLALASYKTQRGWENLDLDTIEPRVDEDLMRIRMQAIREGKTITPPGVSLSDNDARGVRRRLSIGSSSHGSSQHRKKRARTAGPGMEHPQQVIHGQEELPEVSTRHSFRNNGKNRSWKETHRLPQSSPGYHHFDMSHQNQFGYSHSHVDDDLSPTLPQSATFERQPVFHSSPPRTPPHRTIPPRPMYTSGETEGDGTVKPGDGEGADLLLYLATSPSPANTMTRAKVSVAPSTPPSKANALPSSMLNTPGAGGGGGPNTPSNNLFNFHDFVHITPSPAQGLWGPNNGRTPMTMNTRRRLNFDGLVPPSPMNGGTSNGAPGGNGVTSAGSGNVTGLGMELGGELVSSTSGL